MLSYAEPDAQPQHLDPTVDDATLRKLVRDSLVVSRRVSVEEFQTIFHSGVVQKIEKERDAWAMKHYGYKTKRAMYRNMDTCSVAIVGDQIEIQPTNQESLDEYAVGKDEGPFPLYVPATASDAELGAALREGFKRCTSAIR